MRALSLQADAAAKALAKTTKTDIVGASLTALGKPLAAESVAKKGLPTRAREELLTKAKSEHARSNAINGHNAHRKVNAGTAREGQSAQTVASRLGKGKNGRKCELWFKKNKSRHWPKLAPMEIYAYAYDTTPTKIQHKVQFTLQGKPVCLFLPKKEIDRNATEFTLVKDGFDFFIKYV